MKLNRFAVIGSGSMGAQIAAQLSNAGFSVFLFDLKKDDTNLALLGKAKLLKIEPPPLATAAFADFIFPKNLDEDLDCLTSCDLVIEAVLEEVSIKRQLYQKIVPFLGDHTMLSTNTSGLSIAGLARDLPVNVQARFLGMHFFNPPRYLPLVELIPHSHTDSALLDVLETFVVSHLGKEVVRARDTPNFIANRLGVFGLLTTLKYAEAFNIPLEVVDELTGKLIGRPRSATCRTADLVGLDILAHTVATLEETLPSWLQDLIRAGALGAKTKKGIYEKTPEGLNVWDIKTHTYRPATRRADPGFVKALKHEKLKGMWASLKENPLPEAQFLYHLFTDFFAYSSAHLNEISGSTLEVDRALKFGFGWEQGIFELRQALGLPNYPAGKETLPLHLSLPIYRRQSVPASPKIIFENEGAYAWEYQDALTLTFKTKLGTINEAVLHALTEARERAESAYQGLIIWQKDQTHFSAGADLMTLASQFMAGGTEALDKILSLFQHTFLSLRYAKVPVVAAVQGYVLGGGCELAMHTHCVVAALNTYMGLVEVGVGIIPGGGGCKEMAYRASQARNPAATLLRYFKQIGMAETAKSAYEAKDMGYLRETDVVMMNPNELLYVAHAELAALAAKPFTPPREETIPTQGLAAFGNMQGMILNLKAGGFASDYDATIASALAEVLAGGKMNPTSVNAEWMFQKERTAFLNLVQNAETQARVQHMLETGKPLRN